MKKLLLFVILGILFSSCYNKMYHFREKDQAWFNMYKAGDIIKFDCGDYLDKLIITKNKVWDDSSRLIANEGELFEEYHAVAEIDGIFKHKNRETAFWYFVIRGSDSTDVLLSFNIGNHYAFNIDNKENFNNGLYNDTVVFDSLCYELGLAGDGPLEIEWLKWKKGKGIVAYKLSDGTIFDDKIRR